MLHSPSVFCVLKCFTPFRKEVGFTVNGESYVPQIFEKTAQLDVLMQLKLKFRNKRRELTWFTETILRHFSRGNRPLAAMLKAVRRLETKFLCNAAVARHLLAGSLTWES